MRVLNPIFYAKDIEVDVRRTNATKTNGLSTKEHEIVALLHASNHTVAFEMLTH